MLKTCSFCEEPFKDGEPVRFIGDSHFHIIPSKVAFAISNDMTVDELFHKECLSYLLAGGK